MLARSWVSERSWMSWIRVLVRPMFLKYADTMGSRVWLTSILMSPNRWITSGVCR